MRKRGEAIPTSAIDLEMEGTIGQEGTRDRVPTLRGSIARPHREGCVSRRLHRRYG
jgi:hypothetical protein